MICNDMAEYVSALCDGELIPPAAAEHIGSCGTCQEKLQQYLTMGSELRRSASVEISNPIRPLVLTSQQSRLAHWWQKGSTTMRIPRFAFVALLAAVIALGSSLVAVKVRAHADGTVILLSVDAGLEKPVECALSTVDKKFQECGFIGDVGGKIIGYKIRLLSRGTDRVQLGIRGRQWPIVPGDTKSYGLDELDREPEEVHWFEPGDTLRIAGIGKPSLAVRGAWLDHMPSFVGTNEMDPGPDELRIVSPLLLKGKEVVGDLQGGSATQSKPDWGVLLFYPKMGAYLIANSRIQDAVEARVDLNRISFEEDGRKFVFLTGAPVTRAQHVWVLHRPNFDPTTFGPDGQHAFISGEALRQQEPGVWVPSNPMN